MATSVLPKPYVAADQPVHRVRRFHIFFKVGGCFFLVGRILINKGSFQFCLQVAIGREGITLLRFTYCVKFDQVAGYVFNFFFCGFFSLSQVSVPSLFILGTVPSLPLYLDMRLSELIFT